MSKFIERIGSVVGISGAIVTMSDLMQPLAPIAAYVMAASAISLVILAIAKQMNSIWNETLVVSTYLASALFLFSSGLYYIQAQSDDASTSGALASNVPELSRLQGSLGIIDRKLTSIDSSLVSIDTKMDGVKKETSTDPRKELSNMGLTWSYE